MKSKQVLAIFMSATLLITSCTPREGIQDVIEDSEIVKDVVRDITLPVSQKDKRRARHLRASEATGLNVMNDKHIIPIRDSKNNLRGEKSTAQSNGTIVAAFDGWVPVQKNRTYDRVQYFMFKFLDDKAMQTGTISNADGDSSYTTEVWRYHNNSWCAVVPQLKLNIRAAAAHSVAYDTEGGMKVRIFTGSNDGVMGEISFNDKDPYDTSCNRNNIVPLNLMTQSIYNPLFSPADKQMYFSKGQFLGMRIVDTVDFNSTDQKFFYTGKKYLVGWTAASCKTAIDFNTSSGCSGDQMISGDLWFGAIDNDPLKSNLMFKMLDGSNFTYQTVRGQQTMSISNVEPYVEVRNGDYNYYNLAISFGTDSTLPLAMNGMIPIDASKFSVSSVQPIQFDVRITLNSSDIQSNTFPAVTKALPTALGQIQFAELLMEFSNDFTKSLKTDDYQLSFGLMKCRTSAFNFTDLICNLSNEDNSVTPAKQYQNYFPSAGNRKYLQNQNINVIDVPGGKYKLNGRTISQFTGATSITRINPSFEVKNVLQKMNIKDLFSLRAIMYQPVNGVGSQLGLQFNQYGGKPVETGANIITDVPTALAGLNQFATYKDDPNANNSNIYSMDLRDFNILFTPSDDPTLKGLFYIYARGADQNESILNNNSRRSRGGVFLCVAGLGNDDSLISWSNCQVPRDGKSQNRGFGSQFVSSRDIFGEGNNNMAPVALTHSISPDGQIFLNYYSASGAIFTINAIASQGSAFKNWDRIRTGRTDMCTQQLIQPPPPTQESKWKKFGLSGLVTGFAIAAGIALPGMGELLGLTVELLYESMEAGMDDGDDSKVESYQFADAAKLKTTCGVN